MSTDTTGPGPSAPRTRRSLLAAAAAGAAGLAASKLAAPPPTLATDGSPLVVGEPNSTTDSTTTLNAGISSGTVDVLFVDVQTINTGYATAVHARTQNGYALVAEGGGSGGGLDAAGGTTGFGARGASLMTHGVWGITSSSDLFQAGVYGESPAGVGVFGDAGVIGVKGVAPTGNGGWGVFGGGAVGGMFATNLGTALVAHFDAVSPETTTPHPANTAIYAHVGNKAHTGLHVEGGVKLVNRSGRAYVLAGKSSVNVTVTGITSSNIAMATLGASRTGRWVRAVVCASGRITIYLNTTVTSKTPVTWLVLG